MKVAKLVSGILSIVLALLVMFQSCAAGISNALEENGEIGGTGGLLVAICLIVAGIVGMATRNGEGKGASIVTAVFYGLGALVGYATAESYADLNIWATVCLIFAVIYIIAAIKAKKPVKESDNTTAE